MTRPEHDPRNLAEAALPPDEIPQYPPTDLPDVNRPNETTDEAPGTDETSGTDETPGTDTTRGDRHHTTPGNEFPGFPVD